MHAHTCAHESLLASTTGNFVNEKIMKSIGVTQWDMSDNVLYLEKYLKQ